MKSLPLSVETEGEEVSIELIESSPRGDGNSLPDERVLLSSSWGRNPFLLPGEEKLGRSFFLTSYPGEEEVAIAVVREKRGGEEWALTAIIFHETGSRAIINHEIVQEGDLLSGESVKVIKIMPGKVILSREGETFTLRLGPIVPRERKSSEEKEK